MKNLYFVTSGKNGKPGRDGVDGQNGKRASQGQDGGNGTPGQAGQNADDLTLHLAITDDGYVSVKTDKGNQYLPLGDPECAIVINAQGGNGGTGGNGGKGGRGGKGHNGQDADHTRYGRDGGPGGRGGDGGHAAKGGDAGQGGLVQVFVKQADLDCLAYFFDSPPQVSAGSPGRGGLGGKKGSGGLGGDGGNSCHWTSYTTEYDHYDLDMPALHEVQHSHYTRGGVDGSQGEDGQNGKNGRSGNVAKDGQFLITVLATCGSRTYTSPYFLEVRDVNIRSQNPNGIHEPGDKLDVFLTLENTGRMPTPSHQTLICRIESNGLIILDKEVIIKQPIAPSEVRTLQEPIKIHINPKFKVKNRALDEATNLDANIIVSRVNKSFPKISEDDKRLCIQHPINISDLKYKRSFVKGEVINVFYNVKNKSNRPFGHETKNGRSLFVTYKVISSENVRDSDISIKPTATTFGAIEAGRKHSAQTNISAKRHRDLPLFSRIKVRATLYAQPPKRGNIRKSKAQAIETRLLEMQIADHYQSMNGNADVLLVINESTTRKEMQTWDAWLKELDLSYSTWNMSLYDRIDFYHDPKFGNQLCKDFKDKTVVFFNNKYSVSFGKKQRALDEFDGGQYYNILKKAGIKVYLVGSKLDYQPTEKNDTTQFKILSNHDFFSAKKYSEIDDDVVQTKVLRNRLKCRGQDEQFLREKAKDLEQELKSKYPGENYKVYFHYSPKSLRKKRFKELINVGEMSIQHAIPCVHPSVIKSKMTDQQMVKSIKSKKSLHQYNLLKLLPFERKVNFLSLYCQQSAIDRSSRRRIKLLSKAILSDLVEEQRIYHLHKKTDGLKKKHFRARLENLAKFCEINTQRAVIDAKMPILLKLKFMLTKMISKIEHLKYHSRARVVNKVSNQMIDGWLSNVSKNNKLFKQRQNKLENRYKNTFKDDTEQALIERWMSPKKF